MSTISVAPMMAWTDRHCRYLHRLCSPTAVLFTEMVTSAALLHGPSERLLTYNPEEHPVVLQLGGSNPDELASAAAQGQSAGFDEINLNVGCPSPRVQRGRFGACLMREPDLVARCIDAMQQAVNVPVSVKCRLGVDDADSQPLLEAFISTVASTGCRTIYLHARKALLNGLSPAQNREVPPLQYHRVYALKQAFPDLQIHLNGGVDTTEAVVAHLEYVDGVMIGRKAYHAPLFINEIDVLRDNAVPLSAFTVMSDYIDYMDERLACGDRLHDMTRHCLGLFNGLRGARRYRQTLSDAGRLRANDLNLVLEAMTHLSQQAA